MKPRDLDSRALSPLMSAKAMAPASSKMVGGFNHNVQHQGRVFHVQTEDSGVENPHVITHLFVGGNILASKRSSYASHLGLPDLERHVRDLMESQHKEMLRAVVNGSFDGPKAPVAETAPASQRSSSLPPWPPRPAAPPAEPPLTMTEEGIGSIFADDLISEKSLDEVILSYLAGETEQK
jgi:hypothetical protein